MRKVRSVCRKALFLMSPGVLISMWSLFEKISHADTMIWKAWYLWSAMNSPGNPYESASDNENDDEIYGVKEDASGLVRDGFR